MRIVGSALGVDSVRGNRVRSWGPIATWDTEGEAVTTGTENVL